MSKLTLTVYNEAEKGIPFICLHGFLETKEMWSDLHLFFHDRPIYCIDLPGHGESKLDEATICSIETLAEMVLEGIKKLPIETYFLLTHSMGGYVALEMMNKIEGNSIEGLMLLNSHFQADTEEKKINRIRSIQILKRYPNMYFQQAFETLFLTPENHAKTIASLSKKAQKIQPFTVLFYLEAMMNRKDQSDVVKKNNQRIFMIQGKEDSMYMNPAQFQEILPLSNWFTVEDCKHMSIFEQPEEVMRCIQKSLKS